VDFFGNYVRDSWERYKIQSSLRDVELEFGLKQISSSWEVKREKAKSINLDSDLAKLIADSLVNCSDLATWLDRLEQVNIDVRFNLTHTGIARGVTYLKNGEIYQGKDIGASWLRVSKQLTQGADDWALMKAANLKSQERPVQLSKQDRAMFDRVVEMAALELGRERVASPLENRHFKNCRLDIKLDGDTLTVIRLRPHKLMVKATKTREGWEPVGFPNIQQKDVELLERMNKVEPKKFEDSELVIPVKKSSKSTRYAGTPLAYIIY
jgi:hypothetical protein